jgi:hypothetical protein
MAGPQDWGAVPDETEASGPQAWGAVPEQLQQPTPAADLPESFLHRLAIGMAIGGVADKSPEELRQKGFGDFNVPANIASQFKAGMDRVKQGFSEAHDPSSLPLVPSYDIAMGAMQAGLSPITAAFQLAGGISEKATGGLLTSESVQDALMLSGGDLPMLSRVRNGAEQVIGGLPKPEDFRTAADVVAPASKVDAALANLQQLWEERGIHPAEAVHDAERDAFLRQELTQKPITSPPDAWTPENLIATADKPFEPQPGGADVTAPRNLPSVADQPPQPPGKIVEAARASVDQLFGLGRNIQFMLDPMATGSNRAMVIAKDAISSVRRIRWEHAQIDTDLTKRFDLEQLGRMWNAADEESVAAQLGESREHQGLVTLEPEERAAVEQLHARAQSAWLAARDAGIVEGEGLPAYTPRMVLNVAAASEHGGPRALNELGRNVFTRTSQMLERKNLMAEETTAAAKELVARRMRETGASEDEISAAVAKVEIARNIRALPMATARLQEAAIWKDMINKIEDVGKATGSDTVANFNPGKGWFTIVGHPAFTKWQPDFVQNPVTKAWEPRVDDAGKVMFVPKSIYMPEEFKGPMTAILDEPPSKNKAVVGAQSLYGALMVLKGKSMTAILNSPLIHNEVVWSKAMEAAGGREWLGFGLYFRGNRIVNGNAGRAQELIERGLNPMGPRGAYQDISAMMEEPSLQGHQSWTAKVLGFVPGLFDAEAGATVERAIQKAGNFWHNTLLWDRVRDLQFGLADHLSDRLVAKGADRLTADRIAGHFSNIIVGSIPKEAMSAGARATANMLLFSRSFTLGNLSTYKQAIMGLPKPVLAQIERDFGVPAEAAIPEAAQADISQTTKSIARRKAISTIVLSAGLYYVGNALIQHAFNIAARDSSVSEEMNGYARRYKSFMDDVSKDPFELRHLLGRLSPTADNEPAKQDRAHIGYDKDGTAIYARNPTGKFGEEMVGYPTMPLEMVRRKLSPLAGGILEVLENDKGFGRKIYDTNDTSIGGDVNTAFNVAKHMIMRHLPEGQINAGLDLLRGDGDPMVNKLRLAAPAAGFTVSVGAPGGMARGEQLAVKQASEDWFSLHWPDIKKQIQRGDQMGAREAMRGHVPVGMQNGLIRNALNPAGALHGRTLFNFYQTATPEQRDRLERAR